MLFIGLLAFIVILPFHLVLKRLLLDPWGTYWKEILLGAAGAGLGDSEPVAAQIPHPPDRA
jgi:hypothetical protein